LDEPLKRISVLPLLMYFDVYIDGVKLGTYGHSNVKNMSVSVSGIENATFVFAGAVCGEGEINVHYSWAEKEIGPNSEVRIVPVGGGMVSAPIKRYEMGRVERKALESNECGFCRRKETEVPRLIVGDQHRPGICSECVDWCNRILSSGE
jgi:hypothetical protein